MSDTRGVETHIAESTYTAYEGARTGRGTAIATIAIVSFRSVLGLGRPGRYKLLPTLAIVIAYLPAVVLAGVSLFTSNTDDIDIVSYPDYFGITSVAVLLFTALAAPDILSTDRSNGLLPLYLSTPLQIIDYLIAKAVSLLVLMMLLTTVPTLLLWVGYTAAGDGPETVGDSALIVARILLTGLVIAAIYTVVALAITSLSKRRAVASIAIVLVLLATSAGAGAATTDGALHETINLLSVSNLTGDLVLHVFAFVPDSLSGSDYSMPNTGLAPIVPSYLAWVLLGVLITWFSYRRIGSER